MAYTEFTGELDHEEPGYVEFKGELDKPQGIISRGIDAGLSMLTPKKSIAERAQEQSASLAGTAAPQVPGAPVRRDYYNKAVAETPEGASVPDTGIVSRVKNIAAGDKQGQLGKRAVAQALVSTPPDEPIGLLGTLKEGAKATARSIGAAVDTVQGNEADVVSASNDAKNAPKDPALESLLKDINARKKALGENPGWLDSIRAVGGAAMNNPKGAGLLVAEQFPNSLAALGAGAAGMAAGSVAGPAGAVFGGIAGLFGANTALETGNKAIEAASDGRFHTYEQKRVMEEGVTKGAVITGIDAATLGMTNFIMGSTRRAVERATVKTLADNGVDVTSKAAMLAASKNPAIVSAVQASQKLAQKASDTLGKNLARVGGVTALETVGEGAGEYLGEMAATGKADKVDAVIEAFSSMGQSAGEIAFTAARNKAKLATIAGKPIDQLSDSVLRYTANRGSKQAKEAAQAEIDRRASQGVDPEIANAPEAPSEAVDRIVATGRDKVDETRSEAAPDALKSNVLDDEKPQAPAKTQKPKKAKKPAAPATPATPDTPPVTPASVIPPKAESEKKPEPNKAETQESPGTKRKGEVGGKLSAGEIVLTATGRETTPFPKIDLSTNGKAGNTVKRVDSWLIDNAIAEAESRKDELNLLQFKSVKKPSQSDKDSAELYLFHTEQPKVPKPFLKPLITPEQKVDPVAPQAPQEPQKPAKTQKPVQESDLIAKLHELNVPGEHINQARKELDAGDDTLAKDLIRISTPEPKESSPSPTDDITDQIKKVKARLFAHRRKEVQSTLAADREKRAAWVKKEAEIEKELRNLRQQAFTEKPEPDAAPAPKAAKKQSRFHAGDDGINDAIAELRGISHEKEQPGDVALGNGKYASFEDAVRLAREGIESGEFKPAPFQVVNRLDLAFRDVDRVLAAVTKKPAPESKPQPEETETPKEPSSDDDAKAKAQQDLEDGLADLGDIFGKNIRASILPEQEQKLVPVMARVMDAALRLGYYKFKDAARFVMKTIREKLGGEVADLLTLDHLQGAYISMAGKYKDQGADSKKDVVNVESLGDIIDDNTTEDGNDASTGKLENVPGRHQDDDKAKRPDGSGDSKSVDDGVAGKDEATAGVTPIPGSVPESTGVGKTSGTGKPADLANSDGKSAASGAESGATGPGDVKENFTIEDADEIGKGGLGQKYRDNVAAIRIIKATETEGRVATPEERKQLAKYVGWGALKGVFDRNNKQWAKQHAELKALLTDDEWRSAIASTLNAHYTSTPVVKAMYNALARFGFNGGRVLEPSLGSGNFFGMMPAGMRNKSRLHGVELDNLTSRLARALYPSATIAVSTGFQEYQVPAGYFDVAIGNPPFGSEKIVDKDRSEYSGFSIHNYFIARMIDKTRDGGLVPVIVSHNFLDSMSPKSREWVSKRANLIAAVRLPNTAFKQNAGTEVVTDILFFQKTSTPAKNPAWVNATDITLENPKNGETARVSVNNYFLSNPRDVLGRHSAGGSMYRANEYTVEPTGNLPEQLAEFIDRLPKDIFEPIERPIEELNTADNTVPDGVKQGSYYILPSGMIRQRGADVAGLRTSHPWTAKDAGKDRRMRGLIKLRDLLRTQLRLERDPLADPKTIEDNRETLSKAYDAFVKKDGFVNSQANRGVFLDDTESALVQALELDYDAGVTKERAEKNGIEERPASAKKADILSRRVLFPPTESMNVENAKDALLASLNIKGRLDLDYMQDIYKKSEKEIVGELGDVVYKDPQKGWVQADEYLSGDVKTKLVEAQAAAESDPLYKRNVEALAGIIPPDKFPSEIYAPPGAAWIPPSVYQSFAKEITGSDGVRVSYLAATAQWLASDGGRADPAKMASEYGTNKINSFDIFKLLMNGKPVEIKMPVPDPSTSTGFRMVTDEKATEAAKSQMDKIKALWDSWVWKDAERSVNLAGIFNEKFNRTAGRKYDGSHLTFPGMSPAISLRSHQNNVVWRGLQERNVLMDHVVGAGKTYAMVATVMEMKRLGIARKPIFAVPNHLTLQWRSDFSRLYPGSNVLAATPEDFAKNNRERMFAKIATGDYDAVVIGHSSLKKIGLDPEIEQRMYQEQVDEISEAIQSLKAERGDRNTIADMERTKRKLEAKIQELVNKAGERDKVVTFNELGIDAMFIDEMHEFKNLFFLTQKQRVSGLGNPAGSGKAFDTFMKVRWMQQTLGERAPFITATGTPISNSLSEMFTMQRYMRFDELKRDGLHLFDSWSRMYGEDEYVYEVAPSGVGYRISQRFSKFKNLPSLMGHYQSFADVVTLGDLKDQSKAEGKVFPVPKIIGGGPTNIVAKRSPLVQEFFGVPTIRKDDEGRVVYGLDPAKVSIRELSDNQWAVVGDNDQIVGKSVPTREEAELSLVEQALTPVLDLDPNSLLGKFANLRNLMRETKGRVNALSLTGLANKAGLDYRLINQFAADFKDSKINKAVTRMVEIYHQWHGDKGTQLVFCDLSIPLSARAAAATKEKRLYVRDDTGQIVHMKGTLHTVEEMEGFPYYMVRKGKGADARVTVYEPVGGAKLQEGFTNRGEAREWVEGQIATTEGRDRWFDVRDKYLPITQEELGEYRDDHELEVEEDGSNEISPDDLEAATGSSKFSVYDDIKAKLIKKGIPEPEIAFIHDYDTPKKKQELFKQVNKGEVRFLFGSTPKLGAGTNVQERLVGLHHIDAPWRPSDLEQREGRIIRQGNSLYQRDPDGFEVFIGRYATEQTYDTRRWQLLEHKAAGIEQLRKYSGENEVDDVTSEAANAADMKAAASGNPLILEETKLRTNVKRLTALRSAHEDGRYSLQNQISSRQWTANKGYPEQIAAIEGAISKATPMPTGKDAFPEMRIGTKDTNTRPEAEALLTRLIEKVRGEGSVDHTSIVIYRNTKFIFGRTFLSGGLVIHSPIDTEVSRFSEGEKISTSGVITRLNNWIENLEGRKQDTLSRLEALKADIEKLKARVNLPFEFENELEEAKQKHAKVQRALMKSTQMDAVPPEERAAFKKEQETRKTVLKSLGYGKALNEFEGPGSDEPSFSRSTKAATGAGQPNVKAVVDAIRARWKNAPETIIVADMNDPAIPEAVRAENERQLSRGANGQPEGFISGGKVYIVASAMNGPRDVVRVLFHEALGHFGLRGVFGSELDAILKQVSALRRKDVESIAKRYGLNMAVQEDRLKAAEEVLAHLAQTNPQIGFVRRAIAAIRAWLRKTFPSLAAMKMTDDEIINSHLIPARDFVKRGQSSDINGKSAFSRQSQTDSAAFKKWFGNSKVVDKDGKPLVVYHGTNKEFSEFKQSKYGSNGPGIYFTTNRSVAASHGNRVIEAYIKIENERDGIIAGHEVIVRKPQNIKSATGNNGNFDESSPSILFSRKTGITFDSPEPSKMDNLIHALQDKHIDLKRVTEAIKDTGKQIADNLHAYLQEELFHGRTATRVKQFIDKELDPLIKVMRLNGVKMADFEEYLWARHAEERNEQIAKINPDPDMQDGGSGMDTQLARDYLDNLDPKTKAIYAALAKRVDAINKRSRQILVEYGLESQKTIDTWDAAYKHYVPLMREDMDHAFGNGTGQGFSVKGNATKRATGSKRPVVDILANIAQQREKYLIKGEKNRVATALVGLAKENPNADFWKVDTPPTITQVNKTTGLVEVITDPNYKRRDEVIVARIPNSRGTIKERSVVFNAHDPRAMRMAMSLKNLDQDELGVVLNASSIVTRYFASINTQYNPIFGIVNLTRDIGSAVLNLTSTPLAGKQKAILSRTGPALLAIYQSTRGERKGSTVTSQWAQLWEEFQGEGGKTGFRDMYKSAQDRADALEKGLNPDWWQTTRIGKLIAAGGLLNAPERIIADKAVKPLFDWLSDYNDSMENAVRLATYKTALEQGMSKQQAASLAKNLTVNFNRRGAMGRQIGSLYAFFNASVQGTARLAETMAGPAGKKIIAGGIILGGMQAMLLAMSGMGDDEPPEFVKSRSLILPIGEGKYLSVPMPLGFNVLPNIGRITTEFALSGFKDPAKRTTELIGSILDAFNPVGNAGMSLQTIAPTAFDPLAALAENKDWTGKPIARLDHSSTNPTPGFTRAKDSASAFSKMLAEAINSLTGGTKYQPGLASPSPDQIDYLISQATGGVGREASKAQQTVTSAFTGEELPPHKVPLLGRFYGDTKGATSQEAPFYDHIKHLNGIEAEIKGRMQNHEDLEEFKKEHPEWKLIGAANATEQFVQELRKRGRELDKSTRPNKDELKKRMQEKRKEIITRFNERYKEATAAH